MIRFYKNRWKAYSISLCLIAIGVISLIVNGVQLDIQFKGGALIKYNYENSIDLEKVDSIVTETLSRDVDVREIISTVNTESGAQKATSVVLNLSGNEGLSEEAQIALDTALKEGFPESNLVPAGSSVVKPFIGERFLKDSLRALLIAAVLIMLYIWYSFRKIKGLSAGVTALIALLYDVMIVFFTFVIFRIPLNDSFIAAALTILGFSINDTIVIFDRIRENKRLLGTKTPVEELVDKSINQSLTRAINTNLAVFISALIVYIFSVIYNIESIQTFSLPMALGTISGSFTTICITGPIWVSWQKRREKAKTA